MESSYPDLPIMLVDDEAQFLTAARFALSAEGITNVIRVSDSEEVMPRLSRKSCGIVALDITMPKLSGIELLEMITREHPDTNVVMITGLDEVETAVECMKKGAEDYLVKPVSGTTLVSCIRRILAHRSALDEAAALKDYVLHHRLRHPEAFEELVTASPVMRNLFEYVEAIAGTGMPVLITGETGTGKELVARALHRLSRPEGRFVAVNIAGQQESMVDDVLFGHVKGAYTGADRQRRGLVEEAAEGTLFLDEIGDLSPATQLKLLRLIQENEYHPVGSDTLRRSRARIVAATNRDIANAGHFRKDLYYRLHTHEIRIPPLRERSADIPLLTRHFVQCAAGEMGKRPPVLPHQLDTLLAAYDFPGNVRELRSLLFDAVGAHRSGTLSLSRIKERLGGGKRRPSNDKTGIRTHQGLAFPAKLPTLKEAESELIKEALKRANGNKTLAAHLLGVTRQTLNNRTRRQNS